MLSTETTQSIYTERDYMYVSDWQRRRHFILFCRGTVCYLLPEDLYLQVWENSDGRPGSYILNCLNIVIYGAQNLTVYASTKVHEFSEQNFYFNLLFITLVNFSTYVILILSTPNDIIYIELAIFLSQEILLWDWSVSFLQYDNFGISRNYIELC